jgi:integrase
MPKLRLTKINIDRVAKPGLSKAGLLYWDTRSKGFGLCVTPAGSAKFIAQGCIRGTEKEVRLTIGSFGSWTVDQARRRAEQYRHQLEDSEDPRELRRQDEAEKVTLREVADAYMSREGKLKESTKAEMNRHIDKVFSAWKDKPIVEISEDDVRKRFREMSKHGLSGRPAPGQAQISLVTLRTLVNFANRRFKRADGLPLIANNPVHALKDDWREFKPRTRHIEDGKVGEVWNLLSDLRVTARDANARVGVELVRFLMLTGARRSEGGSLLWEHVHLDDDPAQCWWHLPNPKNNNPVWLPLSSQASDLLRDRQKQNRTEHVFPSSRSKQGYINDTRAPLDRINTIPNVASDGANRISAHDLRRSFVTTGFTACRIDLFKLELLTNHIPQGVTARHYLQTFRLQYLYPEVQRIGDWIEEQGKIAEAKTNCGNVVSLSA